jgi:hypothetical protein
MTDSKGRLERWVVVLLALAFGGTALHSIWSIATRSANARNNDLSIFMPSSNPTASVIVSSVLLAAEAVGIVAVLGRGARRNLWRRARGCLALALPMSLVGMFSCGDSYPWFGLHVVWFWKATGLLAVVFVVSWASEVG